MQTCSLRLFPHYSFRERGGGRAETERQREAETQRDRETEMGREW